MAAGDTDDPQARLAALEAEERLVSGRRVLVQERIIFIRGSGLEEQRARQLGDLAEQEAELSERRRGLHAEIDELRALLGLPAWAPTREGRLG